MHCRAFLHWVIQVMLKLFCLKLGAYSFAQFLYYNKKNLWLAPFLHVKVSVVNSAGGSFCWNYATDTFYNNYTGANACCNIQDLRFFCNYVGSTFYYSYIAGPFCCNYAGDWFCCNYAVTSFCSIYAGESFCSEYVDDNYEYVCYNYVGAIFRSSLCTWLLLLYLYTWLFLLQLL